MSKDKLNKLALDAADAVSFNEMTAEEYLSSSGISIDSFIERGLTELAKPRIQTLTKSQTFFRRLVLAARITHECYNELTFGSVKFQKLVYLCEKASSMNFSTNYTKQAAGPFDNKFMHSVKSGFEKQKWFTVQKVKKGKYVKVEFSPMVNMLSYRKYFDKYFHNEKSNIEFLIFTFKKWKTNDIELVATLYSCWLELINNDDEVTDKALIKKLYLFHKQKKKYKPEEIVRAKNWMIETGIFPH